MNKLKIKPLNIDQIVISFDRLTRFKYPEDKYLRVFSDIITGNLIEPKIKKTDIENMDYSRVRDIAQYIINESLNNFSQSNLTDYVINQAIYDYENSVFVLNENSKIFLNNKINYSAFLPLINSNSPKNLIWLKSLVQDVSQETFRHEHASLFPIKKLVIAEGATEETLLPVFAKVCGYDFDKEGIYLISAGGKNQVVKLYYKLADIVKIPIFILLDEDAKENSEEIHHKLRSFDKIHILKCGEFEDLLPVELLKKALNYELSNISMIESDMFSQEIRRTKILEEVFKTRGMHEFKKVEFANSVKVNISSLQDVSPEIMEIIDEIAKFN